MLSSLESSLTSVAASDVTNAVIGAIVILGLIALVLSFTKIGGAFCRYAPTLLTSLGIFGTFTGITIGLMGFDASDIDGSIEVLLNGLKSAFITSLVGILAALILKFLQSTLVAFVVGRRNKGEGTVSEASPEAILGAIRQQSEDLQLLHHAISDDSDTSLIGQLKLLRSDVNDNQKQALQVQRDLLDVSKALEGHVGAQQERFSEFENKLWIKLQDFADMLSKSATETVIEALKQVIVDFNNNLIEQFGDNFKQLNEAVKELVAWQEQYKVP